MNDLETALRNALARGDASNPAFRQRVYRASVDALERALAAQPGADTAKASEQKRRLADAIRSAETGFQAAARAAPAPVSPDVRPESRAAASVAPEAASPVAGLRAEPRAPRRETAEDMPAVERDERPGGRRRRRAPFAMLFTTAVAVAVLGTGIWWVLTTGAWKSLAERDTSVPNPPLQLQNESFAGGGDTGSAAAPARLPSADGRDEGWITLFQPSDPTTVSLGGSASATIEDDAASQFARIVSPDTRSAISIDVPPGTLQALAGKTVQFSIVARADDNAATQMSVTCDLAEAGDCGRWRFQTTQNDNEFLFSVDLPAGVSVTHAGSISIVTDIENKGRAVKLLGVRLRELAS